jgi:acyl-CoA synthetase (AMP-forming)/AMP-acid ligase II
MWLWGSMTARRELPEGVLRGIDASVDLAELSRASSLGAHLEELRGRTVLLAIRDQLKSALALIELDGIARRMVLFPPGVPAEYLPAIIADAGVDACVTDGSMARIAELGLQTCAGVEAVLQPVDVTRQPSHVTEWILLTSGTTGAPKMVLHTLASLTSALGGRQSPSASGPYGTVPSGTVVWSTFYDIRRYGGLQIFLRALHAGSLVLSDPAEPVVDFLARAAAGGVTHISGTPSHWRRALMSGGASVIAPRYVRLSGEIADQAILDSLRAAYPDARIAHAFASTEAGVVFEVGDNLAGFPAALIGASGSDVELKIVDDTLQVRSPGNATRYLGANAEALKQADGFVATGDRLELRDGRYYFAGRSGGVINVGGLKVHPEEVEAVINAHPWVQMSLVKARRSPITGALVTAEVVLADAVNGQQRPPAAEQLRQEIIAACRRTLASHKVPAMVRIVPTLAVSPSGKLLRTGE